MKKVAIIGAAGFIAKRHVQAIKYLKHNLILACDKHENVGYLDSFFPNCEFTTSEKKFFEKVKSKKVDYVVICTPNYLHYSHIIKGLNNGSSVICEKPLVLKKSDFKKLLNLKPKKRNKLNIILQLRLNKNLDKIKSFIKSQKKIKSLNLTYVTPRGNWYQSTWKSNCLKSGGVQTNIGIHLFDIACQLFGDPLKLTKKISNSKTLLGKIVFKSSLEMNFKLSIKKEDLPKGHSSYRVLEINRKNFDLSKSFTNLHVESYKKIINGNGFKVESYKKVFELFN